MTRQKLPDLQSLRLPALKPFTRMQWFVIGLASLLLIFSATGLVSRFAVLTPWGRGIVSGFVNGKSLGRIGRINVYGLRGDVWSDFSLERVTVTDAKGVWLDARAVRVRWDSPELILRTFHARRVDARVVRLVRKPELAPDIAPPGPMPLSIRIDRLTAEAELMQGFGGDYGQLAVSGAMNIRRKGEKQGRILARSLTRPGDFLKADVATGGRRGLQVDAQALEANGGPIAGALGYSPHDPFVLNVQAHGRPGDGRFFAIVRTGAATPLWSQGQWTKSGGRASGIVSLTGSSLLKPWAARVGETLRFGFAAAPARGGAWATDAVVLADNLSAHATGALTAAMTSPQGLKFLLQTRSVARLASVRTGGPARLEGVLAGSSDAWRMNGRAEVDHAGLDGYSLASLSGPVSLVYRNGRLDAQLTVAGSGGAGSGLAAGLLGARPNASARAVRLADGRLYVERFDLTGAGLKASGSGGQGLLRALGFKGQAALTNLGLIRHGATGVVEGPFQASQARAGQPWRVTLDARGRRFVTGLGQLDRLLGDQPRLEASGDLRGGRIEVTRAALAGKAGRADARGLLGLDGSLKLAVDWNAHGPFQAGPVEIAGNMKGNGALTGSLGAPRADLKASLDQIDIGDLSLTHSTLALTFARDPRGYDGQIALVGASAWGPARGRSDFRFAGDGVALEGLSIDAGGVKADGSLALRRGAPSSANLTFAAGPGAFLATGQANGRVKLTEAAPNAGASIQLAASNLQLRGSDLVFRTLKLNGQGTLQRLPFSVDADVVGVTPVSFRGAGVYGRTGTGSASGQNLALDGSGKLRNAVFRTLRPLTLVLGPGGARAVDADLAVGGGRLTATARENGKSLDARANLSSVDLAAFATGVQGSADGSVVLTGRAGRLGGALDLALKGLHARDGPKSLAVDGTLKGQLLGGDRLHLDAVALDRGGAARANASVDLPVVATLAPLHLAIVRTRPISGRYAVSGEVQPIWDLFLGGDRLLAGQVQSQGRLAGTLDRPLVDGAGTLKGGRFEDAGTGLVLRDLNIDAVFDHDAAVFRQFAATDGKGGRATGQGRIDLARGGASNFTVQLAAFEMLNNEIGRARATGPITVTRAADGKIKLTGDLLVPDATLAATLPNTANVVSMDVIEINAAPGRKRFVAPRRGPGAALDVTLRAPGRVVLRGRGLNVEFAVNAHVGGTTSAPVLTGQARVVRGDFNFSGKRFVFDERGVIALSTRPEDIRLDLRAVREDPTLTAVIQVRGTAARPEVTLTSEPALPQDEVLSQVLFGTSAGQLSPIEAAQIASAVAALAGGGGFDVLGNLREFAGLDRLVFGGDQASGLTVAGGKYVSENVYLELIGGGREGGAVQVEWQVRRQISILSRIGGQGDAKLSVRWRKDLK